MAVLLPDKFTFLFNFQTFLQLTTRSFTNNTMQFTVSNNGIQRILEFGPDSVVLSIEDQDENLTISCLEILLAAWCLLLFQREEFLVNHLPRVPVTPNQQATFEMREEVLSSVGAQDTDTSGYELSDLEDNEFSWEDPAVDMDSVYRTGIDTPFSPSIFDYFQIEGSTAANPILVDDEEQGEFTSKNNNTRIWASNRTSEITEKSSIRVSTRKCAWIRIQDSVSLNFVFDTFYVCCVYR